MSYCLLYEMGFSALLRFFPIVKIYFFANIDIFLYLTKISSSLRLGTWWILSLSLQYLISSPTISSITTSSTALPMAMT